MNVRVSVLIATSLVWVPACKKASPPNVAAEVNSRAITFDQLEKQYKLQFPNPSSEASDDQVAIQKLEVLRSMIDNEIMLQRAEKLSLMALDSDVEAKFTDIKAPYTQEDFQRQLDARKITVEEFKAQLRRDLSVNKLFNKEITSHINITDKDVSEFYEANKANFNLAEPQVHLAQVLVTPAAAGAGVRNLKSDDAQNEQQARQKIEMIEARIKQGEDFAMLAQSFSEDSQTAPNGGDLGFVPESSLEQAHPELRKMVMALRPGQVSPVIRTPEGYRLLRVISKEPAGQRQLNDPRVQQTIRETLLNRKDQLLKAVYYEVARNEAQVSNYYAQQLLSSYSEAK